MPQIIIYIKQLWHHSSRFSRQVDMLYNQGKVGIHNA